MNDLFRWGLISELLGTTNQKRFLEIGIQRGVCGSKVQADLKIGVDPAPMAAAQRHYTRVHRCGSDEFFAKLSPDERFDVVLVDGLHHADQVLRDVDNALRHLADDGVIVMHDCNPQSEAAQRVPREVGVWNGDCWKAMVALRQRTDLDAFTVDSDHGLGVVRRRPNASPIPAPDGELTYHLLEQDRRRLLGLVSPVRWRARFGAPLAAGKVTLITAIFGGRDTPVRLPELDIDDAVMFTDGAGGGGWQIERMPTPENPRLAARRIKALALELVVEGDVVLWVDGRIGLTGAPLQPLLLDALARADVASYPHPWRNCAYAEAEECARLGLAEPGRLAAQMATYRAAGFPERHGLWNTMVFARRRTEATVALGRAWWAEIEQHTVRDQVSLPFVLWRAGLQSAALGQDVYRAGSSPHFHRGRHAGAAA